MPDRIKTAVRALLIWMIAVSAHAVEFRVAYEDKDYADHIGTSVQQSNSPGILVEMVAMLPSRIPDLRIDFVRLPWARCLAELEIGQADGLFASSFKPERMKIGVYPMKGGTADRRYRIDTKTYVLYKRADSPLTWDGRKFVNMKLGLVAMRGYSIVDDLRKTGVAVHEVSRSEDAFRMVLAGRADGFAQLIEIGDHVLKKNPEFGSIVRTEPPLATKDYYLQISRQFRDKHPELTQRIWKALAEIRQAEFDRLTAKYMKLHAE